MASLVIDRADLLPPDLQRARYLLAASRVRGNIARPPTPIVVIPARAAAPAPRVMPVPGVGREEVIRRVLALSIDREPPLASGYREFACFKRSMTLREIERDVMVAYGLSRVELWSRARFQAVVQARHEFFFRARHETLLSLPSIARRGGYDHTTVLHGIRRVEGRLRRGIHMKTRPDVIGVNEHGGMILEAPEDKGATP